MGVKLEAGFGIKISVKTRSSDRQVLLVSLAVTKLHRLKVKLCTFIRVAVPIF